MQTETNLTSPQKEGFDQLATGLRSALDEFERTATPENIEAIMSVLRPVGDASMRALRFTADYTKRHPIRMAVTAGLLGFLGVRILKPKFARA